jgi:acetyl-CoA carboxylase biotin carboxyl carrier protein
VGEITVEEHGVRISVRNVVVTESSAARLVSDAAPIADEPAPSRPASDLIAVESPMVGTFYRRPKPDAPAFVEEGDAVSAGQVLCILEAMKLMNEVKAEREGIVRMIHASDGQAVEYGQLLFELEPLSGPPVGI